MQCRQIQIQNSKTMLQISSFVLRFQTVWIESLFRIHFFYGWGFALACLPSRQWHVHFYYCYYWLTHLNKAILPYKLYRNVSLSFATNMVTIIRLFPLLGLSRRFTDLFHFYRSLAQHHHEQKCNFCNRQMLLLFLGPFCVFILSIRFHPI